MPIPLHSCRQSDGRLPGLDPFRSDSGELRSIRCAYAALAVSDDAGPGAGAPGKPLRQLRLSSRLYSDRLECWVNVAHRVPGNEPASGMAR